MSFQPEISYEEQLDYLFKCREAVLSGSDHAEFADSIGYARSTMSYWRAMHAVDTARPCPYNDRFVKSLIVYTYGPWVRNEDLSAALGYGIHTLHWLRWLLDVPLLSRDPWTDLPVIPFRDIVQVAEIVRECESMYLASERTGYSPFDLRFVFNVNNQRIVTDKIQEDRDYKNASKRKKKEKINQSK